MPASIQKPTENCIFENENKLEPPSQPRTESVDALDLASSSSPDNFSPGWRFYTSFISLCIITLAVALDASSLSVALPVIAPSPSINCVIKSYMVPARHGSPEIHRPIYQGIPIKLTLNTRSSLSLSTVAPFPPSGAGHPSS